MSRLSALIYGVVVYALFLGTFLYLIVFVGDLGVPRSVDAGGTESPVGVAVLVNLGLVALYGLQHCIMARPRFKRSWTRIVHPAVERSTFVLATCGLLALTFWQWRPIPEVVWQVDEPTLRGALWAIFGTGWALVLLATFLIDHFDLFGLRQVVLHFRGRPYTHHPFRVPFLYGHVRHPLYVGFLMAVWAAPTLTVGRLLLAFGWTAFMLTAIQFEERDLIGLFGRRYERYRESVPMLIPFTKPKAPHDPATLGDGVVEAV
jgi:methanethiol S-methyltransferase